MSESAPRSPFDALVDEYDAARPHYPAALYDALERLAFPLAGRRVLELGAGTGIATRGLRDRGSDVIAADVGAKMLARLRARLPEVPAVLAAAEQLPLRDTSVDLVAGAQMWHWVRVEAAAREAARVLRPRGALAVWWNDVDAAGLAWWERQQARIEAANPDYSRQYRARDYAAEIAAVDAGFGAARTAEVRWERPLDLDTYDAWLRSKSYVAAIGRSDPRALQNFLAAERNSLARAFPDGIVREPFRTRIIVFPLA